MSKTHKEVHHPGPSRTLQKSPEPPEAKVSGFDKDFGLRPCASGQTSKIGFSGPGAQRPAWTPPGEGKVDYSSMLGTHWGVLARESWSLETH